VGGDADGSGIKARIFNSAGVPAGMEFLVNTTTANAQDRPDVAGVTSGGFTITWQHFNGVDSDIRARAFDTRGTPLGDDILVDGDGGNETSPAIVALAGGLHAIAWDDSGSVGETDGSGSHIRAAIFSGNGAVGSDFLVNTTAGGNQTAPAIARLPSGAFVVTWTDLSNGFFSDVRARVFGSAGAPLDDDFGVDTTVGSNEDRTVVAALVDGSYFVAWTDYGGGGETDGLPGLYVRGEILSGKTGGTVSDEFVVNAIATNNQAAEAVTTLADGRVVVLFTDSSGTPPDNNTAVRGQILDPRTKGVTLNGTALADDWVGTRFNDMMNGGAGNDNLAGAAGSDQLRGQAGNDKIDGGIGNDRLVGGLGTDNLTGGLGQDVFDFDAVADSVRGARHDTVVFSHAQRDKIDLSTIDADTDGTAGNQAFHFVRGPIGHAFTGVDGELRFAGGLLQGDTNGDRVADIEIRVVGALVAGDVIL
jgi:hypothetical protein